MLYDALTTQGVILRLSMSSPESVVEMQNPKPQADLLDPSLHLTRC